METNDIKEALGMNKEQSTGQRFVNILVTSVIAFVVLVFVVGIFQGLGSGGQYGNCDWATGYCEDPYTDYDPSYDPSYDPNDPLDIIDNRNCADIGEEVWVGDEDTDNLDADGDGWGCESYGG